MRCPRCQLEIPAGANFCGECGGRVESLCPSCQAANPPTNKFCHSCGGPLTEGLTASRFLSPEAYTPKHLAEKILISKAALEGERKQVTVLFADLKGSMELLADRDPEEARKLLDPVLERMMEAVHRYEGTVNQVMGDGIMALFGAPLAREDHAVRACYAALAMQQSVAQYAEGVFRAQGVPIQIRVGLNSGEVVVRAIGSDLHMDYTAVGQTTHLAARMEQMATPGTILLTPATLQLSEGYVEVKPLGAVPVKGLAELVEVYELIGAMAMRSRLDVAAARGFTRLVGRDWELHELRHVLERASAGHGQVVALIGEPGVGKSRLYWEFIHSDIAKGWLILDGRSVSYGKTTAYLPVIRLLKRYFQIEERDDIRKVREKVMGKVLSLDRALEPTLPALLSLLDVSSADAQWDRLHPLQRRQRTIEGVKRLLLRESLAQPLLVVFEDLHWIDGESQAFLDSFVESLPTARVLLLLSYRPEYQHGWAGKTYYRQLRIDPLLAKGAEDLLTSLLGIDAGLESLKRKLIEWTEGNPLFIEESVRTLAETKALVGERGAYRLGQGAQTVHVPATVQAILAARIDRLSSEDKSVLQAASVIGRDVPANLLQAITELPAEELREALGRLQGAEFLYEARMFPDLEYAFKHALTQEVAYRSVLHEQRRALHSTIAEAIETLYSDRLGEQTERLAQHAFRGGVWDKAVAYLRQSGLKAFARSAYREAVLWFEQALQAIENLPQTRTILECAIDLRFDLRNSLLPLGEHERYAEHLRCAESIAKTLDDQRRLGWVAAYICAYRYLMGDQDGALESGQRAMAIAEALGDFRLKVVVTTWVGQAHYYRGDYRQAMHFFQQNVNALVGDLTRERFGLPQPPSVHSRTCLIWCLSELGEFAEGIRIGEEGLEIARGVDQAMTLMIADVGLGRLYVRKGDGTNAIALLEPALELIRTWNVALWFPRVASALGIAYALAGRPDDGLPLLEEAVERAANMGLMGGHAMLLVDLSEGYLHAGRPDDALATGRRALALAQDHKEAGHEAWALCLLGEIAARRDPPDPDAAEEHGRRGLALAGALEMSPLLARIHLALGRVSARAGKPAAAREHLAAALARFRQMEMSVSAAEAEAELARLR